MSMLSGVDSDIELKPEEAAEDTREEDGSNKNQLQDLNSIPNSNPNSVAPSTSAQAVVPPKDEPDEDAEKVRRENGVIIDEPTEIRRVKAHALSKRQERKLVEYVEGKFLDVMRNFKKRAHPSSNLPTLSSYLAATRTFLALILQIPPVHPQATLRTALLLRLTGEALSAIFGYTPQSEELVILLDWLEELDRGWSAVLTGQSWDPVEKVGVDVEIPTDADGMTESELTILEAPVTQTDRTRLRSILISCSERLEEWLEHIDILVVPNSNSDGNAGSVDITTLLENIGLRERFEDLFSLTLSHMGAYEPIMEPVVEPGSK